MTLLTGGLISAAVAVVYVLGVVAAVFAVMSSRTPQGSIAWAVALVSMPLLTLPLFLVFGRNRFHGMVNARRANNQHLADIIEELRPYEGKYTVDLATRFGNARVLTELTHMPFIRANETRLLIDGEATFDAIFSAIDQAKKYVVAGFFIVNDDRLGRQFQTTLINATKRGCDVYLLFDEVGSRKLTRGYLTRLRKAGVNVSGVRTNRGRFNRFQINFRNHRKIVVVDGETALIGGLNVGDEYIHRSKRLTPWRDTHMQIDGPAALAVQLAFVEDWLWATGDVPSLNWQPVESGRADKTLFVLPSGPDDEYETCGLFFTHLINSARKRLWIASPYFVPDEGVVTALQLAAMRGVDVRILIPGLADKWLVKRAAMSYVPEVAAAGVKMYEYGKGFLHQKVAVMDNDVSLIGTANFDNRSFRLNFEITVLTMDRDFNQQVHEMLETDFGNSTFLDPEELGKRGFLFKASSRVARLFAPIL